MSKLMHSAKHLDYEATRAQMLQTMLPQLRTHAMAAHLDAQVTRH